MADINKVIFCALFIICLIDVGYGLSCISCSSDDFLSSCRTGGRVNKTKVKCEGRRARCHALATVTDEGESLFERGCSKIGFCKSIDEDDLEFCKTCLYDNCNFAFMDLRPELVEYLLEKKEELEAEEASKEESSEKEASEEDASEKEESEKEAPEKEESEKEESEKETSVEEAFEKEAST